MPETWKDKWALIEIRWAMCKQECLSGSPQLDLRALRCKAAIEALAGDLWALRDWLIRDGTSQLTALDVDSFLESDGYWVRACGDLATRVKHFKVDDARKHLLELERVDTMKQGLPIVFRAIRIFQKPVDQSGIRLATGDSDEYEDAIEMLRRAINQWSGFLHSKLLIPTQFSAQLP